MTRNYLYGVVAAAAFTCAVTTVTPAFAQRRDGGLLPPEKSGQITVAGCLMRGDQVRGGEKGKFVLARPTVGLASVAEAACTADTSADALALDHAKTFVTDSMVGRWVEISGRLEKETSTNPDNLRELDVEQFKMLPVVAPRVAAAPPPAPAPAPAPVPARAEAAPAPPAPIPAEPPALPATASPLPAVGLVGLLAMTGALVLRSFRRG